MQDWGRKYNPQRLNSPGSELHRQEAVSLITVRIVWRKEENNTKTKFQWDYFPLLKFARKLAENLSFMDVKMGSNFADPSQNWVDIADF